VLIVIALAMVVLGSKADELLGHRAHFGPEFHDLFMALRWPVAALAAMTGAALNYYFLPDVKQRFRFITPGSVLGTLTWLLATWGFTQYVEYFGTFNVTYGSIGGVIVLLLWLYVSSVIFILGGELNATIEQLSREGKARGARDVGQAPEPPEKRPSISPPAVAKSAESARRAESDPLTH
jgi:membrane protein